jgi:hypothetical protein
LRTRRTPRLTRRGSRLDAPRQRILTAVRLGGILRSSYVARRTRHAVALKARRPACR